MRLTLQTDYALRMLVYLAVHQAQPCRVTDVATAYGISRNHLLKVALKLGRLGYLTTVRGRSGGIALARRPEDVNLGDVVRQMEDDFALMECMRHDGGLCAISPACRLKGIVGRALAKPFSRCSTASPWRISRETGRSWPGCSACVRPRQSHLAGSRDARGTNDRQPYIL